MTVTLYSKPGCHLCEDVRAMLDDLAAERGFTVEIDIHTNPSLYARYRYEIPVVVLEGREIAKGRIDERTLAAAL